MFNPIDFIISCCTGLGHLTSGMIVSGVIKGTNRSLYYSYYCPVAVSADNADIISVISYI